MMTALIYLAILIIVSIVIAWLKVPEPVNRIAKVVLSNADIEAARRLIEQFEGNARPGISKPESHMIEPNEFINTVPEDKRPAFFAVLRASVSDPKLAQKMLKDDPSLRPHVVALNEILRNARIKRQKAT